MKDGFKHFEINLLQNFVMQKCLCANGTDALTIALKKPHSQKRLIPAITYCSTAFSVINALAFLVDLEKNKLI